VSKPIPGRLTLGQLGKLVGLARTSLLHYESLGLLVPSARSAAGYRLYGEPEVERLRVICRLRDAGLPLADIGALLAPAKARESRKPAELLQRRLLDLSRTIEAVREQQRSLARLLAIPEFRDRNARWNKAAWVALLRHAGFGDDDMRQWHAEFERENPAQHAAFLKCLGLGSAEAAAIRAWSKSLRPGRA
jgi:DNA-binding transcriptional MerR regulator